MAMVLDNYNKGSGKQKKSSIQNGVVLYSKITQIFYKMIKGELWKYPTYGNTVRGWGKSQYRGDFKGMTKATKAQLEELKC